MKKPRFVSGYVCIAILGWLIISTCVSSARAAGAQVGYCSLEQSGNQATTHYLLWDNGDLYRRDGRLPTDAGWTPYCPKTRSRCGATTC